MLDYQLVLRYGTIDRTDFLTNEELSAGDGRPRGGKSSPYDSEIGLRDVGYWSGWRRDHRGRKRKTSVSSFSTARDSNPFDTA